MPRYEITSPDGKRFEITAPEGATQDQVLAYAKEQFSQQQPATPVAPAMSEQQKAIADFKARPWGSGFGPFAHEAGGRVTDLTGSPVAGGITNALINAAPMALTAFGAQKSAAPAMEGAAQSLMQSALKPSKEARRTGDAQKAITTMLEEGINVSQGGVGKLRGAIDDLNKEIAERIANSTATVDKGKAAAELGGLIKKFERQATPGGDIRAIENAWTEFLSHPLIKGNELPVQLAQQIKQGTYSILKGKFGEQGSAAVEAQKTIARGLKEGIAEAVPEVGKLNAKESGLLNALKLAEERALQAGNNNPGGLSWLASNPAAWAAFMADKSSAFKSAAARLLYSSRNAAPAVSGFAAGGAAVSPAREE